MRNYQALQTGELLTTLCGIEVLHTPQVNKGTAFTESERTDLGLDGLLPPAILTLEEQAIRAYEQFSTQQTDLQKHVYLMSLHDRNEVLFYHLLTTHLAEMLPIVYTPTIGEAIQRYSHEYRRPGGVYLSIDNRDRMDEAFYNFGLDAEDVDLIVVTDSERILGIGDWGVGGIDIAIGKLAVYTAAAGIDPRRVIPVVLDVGTNRESLLEDRLYIGARHRRVEGPTYDDFIDQFVRTVSRLFPNAMLHWEDFAQANARPILERYRTKLCTFNDDIQGTGAVTLAAVLSASRMTRLPLALQRIVLFGAGSAGIGVADQIVDAMIKRGLARDEANLRFWCVDKSGLLTDNAELRECQRPYARKAEETIDWTRDGEMGTISLLEVVRQVHPTILIGLSAVPGAFTEDVIREMAHHVEHPVVMPLSNPTDAAEARPENIVKWTDGRAFIATGSPFPPVPFKGTKHEIGQSNNAFVFPGIGLGTIVTRASRVTDNMMIAAAEAVADYGAKDGRSQTLLPSVRNLQSVSFSVAVRVAYAAMKDGVARIYPRNVQDAVRQSMWAPIYRPVYSLQSYTEKHIETGANLFSDDCSSVV